MSRMTDSMKLSAFLLTLLVSESLIRCFSISLRNVYLRQEKHGDARPKRTSPRCGFCRSRIQKRSLTESCAFSGSPGPMPGLPRAMPTLEPREPRGITDGFIRLSVGLEHIDDLVSDALRAFKD